MIPMRPRALRRSASALLAICVLVTGCAGPTKLAERSQRKLAGGDIWEAWRLATRALDREPMNPRARDAVAAAGAVISSDWQRRIHALADVDSLRAAEQVLAFADFRAEAAQYTTVDVAPGWSAAERDLRRAAAHQHYTQGKQSSRARRPKAAYGSFRECERYVDDYRDAAKLADAEYARAVTRIAVLPFSAPPGDATFGRDVAESWRDAVAAELTPEHARFTRVLGSEDVNGRITLAQAGRLTREEALAIGRRSGARQIVWGSLGRIASETSLQYFRDVISRRVVSKDADGNRVARWVDVPIEVVARVRDVSVDVEYEVASTLDGTTLVHEQGPRTARARVVWTSYVPEGDLNGYALVSDARRQSDPARAKDIETRWRQVCGESTTLHQVLAARREARGGGGYDRSVLGRFVTGTALVFLQELPPAEELAHEAVRHGWRPLVEHLARLDGVDEVDLGVTLTDSRD